MLIPLFHTQNMHISNYTFQGKTRGFSDEFSRSEAHKQAETGRKGDENQWQSLIHYIRLWINSATSFENMQKY